MSETPPEETGAQKIPPELLTGGILPEDNTSYYVEVYGKYLKRKDEKQWNLSMQR